MNTDQAKTAAETLAALWESEFPATCQVLAAVKDDNLSGKAEAGARPGFGNNHSIHL